MTKQVDRFFASSVYQKLGQRSVLRKGLEFARNSGESSIVFRRFLTRCVSEGRVSSHPPRSTTDPPRGLRGRVTCATTEAHTWENPGQQAERLPKRLGAGFQDRRQGSNLCS